MGILIGCVYVCEDGHREVLFTTWWNVSLYDETLTNDPQSTPWRTEGEYTPKGM